MGAHLSGSTRRVIASVFDHLDYKRLESVYCYEGGEEFWRAKREPCRRLGTKVAEVLIKKLPHGGRSLYVGAGVTELPALLAEAIELQRLVAPYNLRRSEVTVLNRACRSLPVRFKSQDAASAPGLCDHLWIVSVLNDPERFHIWHRYPTRRLIRSRSILYDFRKNGKPSKRSSSSACRN